jgi:hypothetical protein
MASERRHGTWCTQAVAEGGATKGIAPEWLRVFETANYARDAIEGLAVELPTAWARNHGRVKVELTRVSDELGWHAHLVGDEQAYLLGFPWYDHVEAMLLARGARRVPLDLDEGAWDVIEPGWWASVIPVGPWVFLAEANFDELVDWVRDPEKISVADPGRGDRRRSRDSVVTDRPSCVQQRVEPRERVLLGDQLVRAGRASLPCASVAERRQRRRLPSWTSRRGAYGCNAPEGEG